MTSLKDLQASAAEMGRTMCTATVVRVLQQSELYGRLAKKTSVKKLEFAKRHVEDSDINWKKVVWSEETKILLFGHQIRHYVWKTLCSITNASSPL